MPEVAVILRRVDGDREPFVPLLLEADESESILRDYLDDGELHELLSQGVSVGVVLLIAMKSDELEIKNIALAAEHRGRGLGRAAIRAIAEYARTQGCQRLSVGTADSSTGTLAFYRACGFDAAGRDEGFFDGYPEPVIEHGVEAHDMIRFAMPL